MRRFRAVIFDCNGIIVNDEPIHLKLFQKVLREEGIILTRKEYFKKYLAMDDRSCFKDVLESHCLLSSKNRVQELIRRKAAYYKETIKKEFIIFPGVKSFVKKHQKRYVLAIVSGALRSEIDWILRKAGIFSAFSVIVSAEDVRNGKPSPECYLTALKYLNRMPEFRGDSLKAGQCLAIEDSIHGVESAQKAGMKCMAITNSYSAKELSKADSVKKSLSGVQISGLKF